MPRRTRNFPRGGSLQHVVRGYHARAMRITAVVLPLLLAGCTVPSTVHRLDSEAPPPELGRPDWVRIPARIGAWIGAIGGAVVSVAALPVTLPVATFADEPLGYAKSEFVFLPVAAGASAGHFVLGAPADTVDFLFRRAWVEREGPPPYDFVPMAPPQGPEPEDLPAIQPVSPSTEEPPAPTQSSPPSGEQPEQPAGEKPPTTPDAPRGGAEQPPR